MLRPLLISAFAILAGLLLITLVAEGVEVVIVTLATDKPLSELANNPSDYFAIRNRPVILALKLVYNTMAAFAGGYICALVARNKLLVHGIILASIQTIGFIYGMTMSEFADTTPMWLWLTLIFLTIGAIMAATYIRNQRYKQTS